MHEVMKNSIQEILAGRGIVAVLEIDNAETAVPVARALIAGGVTVIELALRTPAALTAMSRIARDVPEMVIGAGTVIQSGQARKVMEHGASFGVSPGYNPKILEEARECRFPFAPGVATASEIEGAIDQGCSVLKLFPAEQIGGIPYFKGLSAPYAHLGLNYFPLGGVTEESLEHWVELKQVIAVGGSWIAKRELINAGQYEEITKRAARAMEIWTRSRGV